MMLSKITMIKLFLVARIAEGHFYLIDYKSISESAIRLMEFKIVLLAQKEVWEEV